MQGPMLKALRRFTQLLRVHIYVPGCCKYIRMTNGLQPLVELCMDGCFADRVAFRCKHEKQNATRSVLARRAGSGRSLRSERRTAGTKPSLAASEVMTGFANFNQRSKLVRMYKRNT